MLQELRLKTKMESISELVTSFLDIEANKGAFRNELARILKMLPSDIQDIWLETEYVGTVHHYLFVSISERIPKDDLMKIPFDYIDSSGCLIFDVGEFVI